MNRFKTLRKSLSFYITVVLLLVAFSGVVTIIGYKSFDNSLKEEYEETTGGIAKTASTLVNGDHIDAYLEGKYQDEFLLSQSRMDILCEKMDAYVIYVIKVDTKDYKHYISVFNSVNTKKTDYTRWELGSVHDTTNAQYEAAYRDLYDHKEVDSIVRKTQLNGAPQHITSLISIEDSKGNVTGVLCVQRPMEVISNTRNNYLISVAVSVIITAVLAAYLVLNYLRKQFIKPINEIIQEAERFARENTVTKCEDLSNISRINEIAILASSISKMEKDNAAYIESIKSITSEKERIGTELDVASKIQTGSIPNKFPAFPDRNDFDIFANMTPAKEVGGDFYDFFFIDDDHLALVIADVSGKGIPAALFMMVTKILIKEKCRISGGEASEILEFVNDRVCANNSADMFVTVWFGIMELSSGKINCVNAGHEDPVIYRKGGEFELFKNKHGLAVGALESVHYRSYEICLEKGDKLFLYTDGVPEATNAHDELFGLQRMIQALNEVSALSPEQILEHVEAKVNDFVGEAPQFDDLTMLCFDYRGGENMNNTLHIQAQKDNLDEVNAFLETYMEGIGCSMKIQTQIILAVEEIFVNIANYAYAPNTGDVDFRLSCDATTFTIVIEDSGIEYNPLKKQDPDITLSAEERQIGGLGIFMTKKIMDDVIYSYKNGKNTLKLVKKYK